MTENRPLVSIIIPCYNAERWVAEAIQSCLDQTWQPREVIVIDDGSTDGSLDVIKSFGDKIRWETGPNRGGNAARNRGFALAKGEYIQFLDADDFLRPGKIARQMATLESSQADVVYEDWQRMQEKADGSKFFHPPEISGRHDDVLAELLSSWAPPPCAFLFRHRVVGAVGGWNESLTSAQDWEMHIRMAMRGHGYVYLPGCESVYRRPATPTVSTCNNQKYHENVAVVLKAAEQELLRDNRLQESYRVAMAHSYFKMARSCYAAGDRRQFDRFLGEARRLTRYFGRRMTWSYRLLIGTMGVERGEWLCALKRRLRAKI
jgi:glycosyltransferase involved in cell wall biosynthesis